MCVWILLEEAVGAFATAVVSIVDLRGYDPVPSELFEVYNKGVPTTSGFFRVFCAIHADGASCALVRIVL